MRCRSSTTNYGGDALQCNAVPCSRGLPVTVLHDLPDLADLTAATVDISCTRLLSTRRLSLASMTSDVGLVQHRQRYLRLTLINIHSSMADQGRLWLSPLPFVDQRLALGVSGSLRPPPSRLGFSTDPGVVSPSLVEKRSQPEQARPTGHYNVR